MADLTEEINDNISEDIIHKYYGRKNLGGVDLLIFNKLFELENEFKINGNDFIKKIDYLLNKFKYFDRTPLWMVVILN